MAERRWRGRTPPPWLCSRLAPPCWRQVLRLQPQRWWSLARQLGPQSCGCVVAEVAARPSRKYSGWVDGPQLRARRCWRGSWLVMALLLLPVLALLLLLSSPLQRLPPQAVPVWTSLPALVRPWYVVPVELTLAAGLAQRPPAQPDLEQAELLQEWRPPPWPVRLRACA